MRLWLSHAQARDLVHYAHDAAPFEACGVLAGHGEQVTHIFPVPNVASEPHTRYQLDAQRLVTVFAQLERDNLTLLGFYHSHPNGEALPSPTDIREATYPDVAYVIVGLKDVPRISAWRLRWGEAETVELHIGDEPPAPSVSGTNAQKIAVLVSALLAFLLLLMVSLTLLPPAPELPVR